MANEVPRTKLQRASHARAYRIKRRRSHGFDALALLNAACAVDELKGKHDSHV